MPRHMQTYINTYAARKQNIVVIKWKVFHFLKASLGPNSLGHIQTALPFSTWETDNAQYCSSILFPINI